MSASVKIFKDSVLVDGWDYYQPTLKPDKDGNIVFSYSTCVGPGQWHMYYMDKEGNFWNEYRYFEHEEPYDDYYKFECSVEDMISHMQYLQNFFAKKGVHKYVRIYKRVEKYIKSL